jgi:hypothetical protein
MSSKKWAAFGLLAVMYVLHNDWWLWSDSTIIAGLPVGLGYHVLYMILTALVLVIVVRLAWPTHLDSEGNR